MSNQSWNIDSTHSVVAFTARHLVFAKVRGRFNAFRGTFQLDPDDLVSAQLSVEIDAASVDTGVADRDQHLRSADFFEVARFPTLRFVSQRIERTGADRYLVHGQLTIRDVTREVTLDADYGGRGRDPWGNDRVAFSAKASLDRRDFGLRWNQALEAGGVLVGDRVELEFEVELVAASATVAA